MAPEYTNKRSCSTVILAEPEEGRNKESSCKEEQSEDLFVEDMELVYGEDDEFDDRTLLDIFAAAAKDWLTHRAVRYNIACFGSNGSPFSHILFVHFRSLFQDS